MTTPPVMRIFFAIDLPEQVKIRLGEFISQLKKQAKTHGIRWSKPENLHITLQFLADAKTPEITEIVNNVRKNLKFDPDGVDVKFGELQLFPHPFQPRVIVLDVEPQKALSELSAQIGKGIKELDYPLDTRPFNAHLTLGRIKHPKSVNLDFLANQMVPDDLAIPLREVTLFRSQPSPDGSQYTPLERVNLTRPDRALELK